MERPKPTGKEITFGEDEIIVSKTDTRGIITYSNTVFQRVSGYSEEELQGKPHNILRLMWYRLLGQVGVKFVYEGGVGALPLSENGNKARRRKEAIAN